MIAENASVPSQGDIGSTGVAPILLELEGRRATARARFDTEFGEGEVDVINGEIVDVYLGDRIGMPALFALFGATEGRFNVSDQALEPRPPLIASVNEVIARRAARAEEWRKVCERAPSLHAVLRLSPDGEKARSDQSLSGYERSVLGLVDGHRTVTEVIDESGIDAVDALATLARGTSLGWLREAAPGDSVMPQPVKVIPADAAAGGSETAARSSWKQEVHPATSLSGISLRRRTSIGIGIPEHLIRPTTQTHKIITVGASPSAAPVPVKALRRSTPPPPQTTSNDASVTGPAPSKGGRKYLGRYELLCRLGYGGMGSVYLCRLMSEGGFRRLCAIKVLRSHLSQDSDAARKFLEEARLAGHVHHPNVVSVLDAGFEGQQPYLVMDYIEGASLKRLLTAETKARPPELIVPIVLDSLAGLQAAHTVVTDDGVALHIVHCDVSPENLLVGVDGVCRLADFGVARHGTATLERSESAQGKPGYLSPEQVTGSRVDQRADVFAMGVVLYNALTGIRLFEAPTVAEMLKLVRAADVRPPSTVGLRPPPSLDFVCMKALERDPERRFTSAAEMMDLLRRIALREDLLAPPTEVATWVQSVVGSELAQRRLAVLDAARRPRGTSDPPSRRLEPELSSSTAHALPAAPGEPQSQRAAGEPEGEHLSRTMFLPITEPKRPWALIIAAALATLAVLVTLIWPRVVSNLFRLNTDVTEAKEPVIVPTPAASETSGVTKAGTPAPPTLEPSGETRSGK